MFRGDTPATVAALYSVRDRYATSVLAALALSVASIFPVSSSRAMIWLVIWPTAARQTGQTRVCVVSSRSSRLAPIGCRANHHKALSTQGGVVSRGRKWGGGRGTRRGEDSGRLGGVYSRGGRARMSASRPRR